MLSEALARSVAVVLFLSNSVHVADSQTPRDPVRLDAWDRLERLLKPGDTIVVERLAGASLRGKYVDSDAASLTLRVDGASRQLRDVEVSRVTLMQFTKRCAAFIGALVGGGIGTALTTGQEDFDAGGRLLLTAIGAGAGAGLGFLAGRRGTPYAVYVRETARRD